MRSIFDFGLLTALCIITAFLADVLLAPALVVLVRGRSRQHETESLVAEGA